MGARPRGIVSHRIRDYVRATRHLTTSEALTLASRLIERTRRETVMREVFEMLGPVLRPLKQARDIERPPLEKETP